MQHRALQRQAGFAIPEKWHFFMMTKWAMSPGGFLAYFSSRRLLHWLIGLLFRVSWPKSFQHGVVFSVEGLEFRVLSLKGSSQDGICQADAV